MLPMLALVGAGLLPLALDPPVPVAAVLLAAAGFGLAYELGRQQEFREAIPPGREAVVFGLLGTGMMTGQGVGPLLAGPLGGLLHAGPAMAVCGALVLVSAALLRGALRA